MMTTFVVYTSDAPPDYYGEHRRGLCLTRWPGLYPTAQETASAAEACSVGVERDYKWEPSQSWKHVG